MSDSPRSVSRQRLIALLLTGLSALTAALFCYISGLSAPFDRAFEDFSTRLSSAAVPSNVVIVEIDARSLHELGAWPWPRSRHGALIDTLQRLGAERIFVDIDFSAPSRPEEDAQLAEALGRTRGLLVLPQFWQPLSADSKPLLLSEPLPALRARATLGSVNLMPDSDGLVRDVPEFITTEATSAPPVWRALAGKAPRTALLIDYRIAPNSFPKYAYSDVLQGAVRPNLHGKTVMIGATAIELNDIVPVPVYRSLPGVVVQATAYQSGLRVPLRQANPVAFALVLALCAALCVLTMSRGAWRTLPWVALAWTAGSLHASYLFHRHFNLLPEPAPVIIIILCSLVGCALTMLYTETWRSWQAGRRLRQQDALLRQIVDQSVDALITLDPGGRILTWNGATVALIHSEKQLVAGTPLGDLMPAMRGLLGRLTPEREVLREALTLTRADGQEISLEVSAKHLPWEDSSVVAISLHDVSDQRRREAELRYRATHDSLTGLPNRLRLVELLTDRLPLASAERPLKVLMLDLDGFKEVNDTLGREMGDALLVELGQRLAALDSRCACVARLGGDEFAILVDDVPPDVAALYAQIHSMVSTPIFVRSVPISLGSSLGVATAPDHGTAPDALLRCAGLALAAAKRARTAVEDFEPTMDVRSPRRLQMLTQLRSAIDRNELFLVFQPKVSLGSQSSLEVEVLCRWNSVSLGFVSPAEFIPLAEASDVIRPLTEWTLRRALYCAARWHAQGLPIKVAVNLSARHLQDEQLPTWLERLLADSGISAPFLELEITEGAIMRDPDRATRILSRIRELGITLSIDDYGTGYSSLSYLQKLSVDRLKIDKSFVSGLLSNERDRLIVKSTIDLAHALQLQVIAEGIESGDQLAALRDLDCDYAQGYLLSRPLPFEQVGEWFRGRTPISSMPIAIGQ